MCNHKVLSQSLYNHFCPVDNIKARFIFCLFPQRQEIQSNLPNSSNLLAVFLLHFLIKRTVKESYWVSHAVWYETLLTHFKCSHLYIFQCCFCQHTWKAYIAKWVIFWEAFSFSMKAFQLIIWCFKFQRIMRLFWSGVT